MQCISRSLILFTQGSKMKANYSPQPDKSVQDCHQKHLITQESLEDHTSVKIILSALFPTGLHSSSYLLNIIETPPF